MIFAIGTPGQRPRILLTATDQDVAALSADAGEVVVPVGGVADYVIAADGSEAVLRTPTLDEHRATIWVAVKSRRRRAEQAGCTTPWGQVQTDVESQSRIATYAANAPSAGWSIDWTMADNTVVSLSGEDLRTMSWAVMQHLEACHVRAQALRAAIDAALSLDAVISIDIDAGWPDAGGPA